MEKGGAWEAWRRVRRWELGERGAGARPGGVFSGCVARGAASEKRGRDRRGSYAGGKQYG